MEWKLLTREDYATTNWSGGTTTQLSIAPEGAVYADRDFLWRLSSATVEDGESEFTPLPDYNRWILLLDGVLSGSSHFVLPLFWPFGLRSSSFPSCRSTDRVRFT